MSTSNNKIWNSRLSNSNNLFNIRPWWHSFHPNSSKSCKLRWWRCSNNRDNIMQPCFLNNNNNFNNNKNKIYKIRRVNKVLLEQVPQLLLQQLPISQEVITQVPMLLNQLQLIHLLKPTLWWLPSNINNNNKSIHSRWTKAYKWIKWTRWTQCSSSNRWYTKCSIDSPISTSRDQTSKTKRTPRRTRNKQRTRRLSLPTNQMKLKFRRS